MLYNGRGGVFLLPKLSAYADAVCAKIGVLAAAESTVEDWATTKATPKIVRLCDEPADLIQPASPALVLTFSGQSVITPAILYGYQVQLSYVYASPVEREWGDDALYACMVAAEAAYAAAKEARPAGVVAIGYNGYQVSSYMTSSGTTPLLSRIMTMDLEFQVEEDF